MSALDDKLIELIFFPHSDLFISWPSFIKESFSSERSRGRICVNYSEVPALVYILASKIGADFLPTKILEEAKSRDFISYAHENYSEFCEHIGQAIEFRKKLWDSLKEDKIRNTIPYTKLKYLKENLSFCEYIGYIPTSAEYPDVDILSQDGEIYLAQRKDILKLNDVLSKDILKQTLEHYSALISPVLRGLLEK